MGKIREFFLPTGHCRIDQSVNNLYRGSIQGRISIMEKPKNIRRSAIRCKSRGNR